MNVIHLISSGGHYGVENMVINLSKSLEKLGCRSMIGVFDNRHRSHTEIAEHARAAGLDVELIRCAGRVDLEAARTIRRLIKTRGIDLVHSHGYKTNLYGYAAVRSFGTPIVATCHLWFPWSFPLWAYSVLDRRLLRRFPRVIAVSEGVSRTLQHSGIPPHQITLIDNGIDLSHFEGAVATLPERLKSDSRPIVGTVGRLAEQKGLEHLLRAAQSVLARFPEALFVLVGEGPLRSSLETQTRQLGIERNVIFAGQRNDMPGVYASFDVFVLASLDEGMPMAMLEAMAAARPVVATRVGAVPRLVLPEQTGLLVDSGDPAGLAEAIERLLGDPPFRRELGVRARGHVAQFFSADVMAGKYVALYKKLLHEL
jgi:glycosyltransferase involved in cell wall biosynthesis